MAYRNADHVRDERLYAYMNLVELEQFQQAMAIKNMGQPCTALRTFALERSEQIIIEHKQAMIDKQKFNQSQPIMPTVHYQLPSGRSTADDSNDVIEITYCC